MLRSTRHSTRRNHFCRCRPQATHDGICSPIAVLQDENGSTRSLGAAPPVGIVVPAHVVERSPRRCLVSGVADLASNILAVADWRWARQFAGEDFDDYAALLAETGAQLMLARRASLDPESAFTREDVELLVRGLVLSGLAMTLAGTSRPSSGSEHLLSHAFDEIGAGHGTHGEQVAVACRLAAALYDDNSEIAAVGGAARRGRCTGVAARHRDLQRGRLASAPAGAERQTGPSYATDPCARGRLRVRRASRRPGLVVTASQTRDVHAAILAAGLSSRFGGTQKALYAIDGVSLLERWIRHLHRAGVSRVTVVSGHRAEEVERATRDLGLEAVTTFENERYDVWDNSTR